MSVVTAPRVPTGTAAPVSVSRRPPSATSAPEPPASSAPSPTGPRGRRRLVADRSVRTKILALVGLFAIVVSTVGAFAITGFTDLKERAADLADTQSSVNGALAGLKDALWTIRVSVYTVPAATEADKQRTYDGLQAAYATFEERLATFEQDYTEHLGSVPGNWESFLAAFATYREAVDGELVPAAMDDDRVRFEELRAGGLADAGAALVAALGEVDTEVSGAMTGMADAAEDEADATTSLVIAITLVGLALAVVVGVLLARAIRRSVMDVKNSVDALAEGDLTAEPAVRSDDELGKMAGALVTAQGSLRSTLAGVVDVAGAVAAASEEMSAAGAQVSAGAEETSAQAGVVAAAAEQVSRNVQAVAAGAEEMGASIREIAQNAHEAAKVAEQATAVAASTNETVAKLGVARARSVTWSR